MIPETDLVEHKLDSEPVFDGGLLHVLRDRVRLPDGSEAVREHILHPGAVMIIPLLENGNLVMERQYRYPLHRVFLELPAGKIDAGENPLATAQRELLEETGYVAVEWQRLGCIHPVISYSNEQIDIYLARGLTLQQRALDHGEFLDVIEIPFLAAMEMVRTGEITDAKTLAGLFWVERVLNGAWNVR
jgi:ADP-ribose pyrophosphatase